MNTADSLNLLNETHKNHLEYLHNYYSEADTYNFGVRNEMRARISEYLTALTNCNIISDCDRKRLFCYYTL